MSTLTVFQGSQFSVTGLPKSRDFIATKFGVTIPERAKGEKPISNKELLALVVAAGHSEADFKAAKKEFDVVRSEHHINSGMAIAMMASNPNIRKSLREAKNKDGQVIGFNASFRKERSSAQSKANRIAELERQLAAAVAKLAALPVA